MDDSLDILIALSHTGLEHDKETMVPGRIVPDVAL
jgi:2',3'-cyclic-nucleotide 2'-phosphodiesterase (5'-nucleotidase family)